MGGFFIRGPGGIFNRVDSTLLNERLRLQQNTWTRRIQMQIRSVDTRIKIQFKYVYVTTLAYIVCTCGNTALNINTDRDEAIQTKYILTLYDRLSTSEIFVTSWFIVTGNPKQRRHAENVTVVRRTQTYLRPRPGRPNGLAALLGSLELNWPA